MIQMPVESIRSTNRVAMGVRLVSLDSGDSVAALTKVDNGVARAEEQAALLES